MTGRFLSSTALLCVIALGIVVPTQAQPERIDIAVKEPSSVAPGSSSCEILPNTSVVVCDDLDMAIQYTLSVHQDVTTNRTVVYILLPRGIHYITTQTNFRDGDVQFVGTDSDVSVLCDYPADTDTNDITEIHTWYFNQSRDVRFENIHFKDCGFPFRLFSVVEVNVFNCTFM